MKEGIFEIGKEDKTSSTYKHLYVKVIKNCDAIGISHNSKLFVCMYAITKPLNRHKPRLD
jgi:hypothetical protein